MEHWSVCVDLVGLAADAIITAQVEVREAKQELLRLLVQHDEGFKPPADYTVSEQVCVWLIVGHCAKRVLCYY